MPDLLSGILGIKGVEVPGVSMILQPDPTTGNVASAFPVFDAVKGLYMDAVRVNTVEIIVSATKPTTRKDGTALAANDLWYDTATNLLWFWNGTYWLSEQLFVHSSGVQLDITNASGNGEGSSMLIAPDLPYSADIFIVNVIGNTLPVGTAQTSGNHYTITAGWQDTAYNTHIIGTGFNTTGDTDSVDNRHSAASGTFFDVSAHPTFIRLVTIATPTGTPGRILTSMAFTYRLAHS